MHNIIEDHMSRPTNCSEPRAIIRFLDSGHPWMALMVTLAWLKPVRVGSLIGAGLLLHHLL